MEWKTFFRTWRGMAFANRAKDVLIVGLVAISAILAYGVATQDTVVTLQPPPSAKTVDIGRSHASPQFEQLWAVYVAELVANVTPETAERVRASVGPLLAPEIRSEVMSVLDANLTTIKRDQVSASYAVTEVRYDLHNEGRIYVVGYTTLESVTDESQRSQRTFVLDVKVSDYRPMVSYFNAISGTPEDAA